MFEASVDGASQLRVGESGRVRWGEPCAVRMWLFTPLPTATSLMTDVTSTVSSAPPVTAADLDRFARLDSLGLTVTGQQIFPDRAVLFCQVTGSNRVQWRAFAGSSQSRV